MNRANDPKTDMSPIWDKPWPTTELQDVPLCPVCECSKRIVLRDGLVDNVFFVAQGRWVLYQCARCKTAYLNPRPDVGSIAKAYGTYYTHKAAGGTRVNTDQLNWLRRLQRRVANGYVNARYGTYRQPASCLGWFILKPLPKVRQKLDFEFRHLPKPRPNQRLLDAGCGNGSFMSSAAEAGWKVSGVDPDPQAVATAKGLGLDVRQGSIKVFEDLASCFDVVTLSHVIEHVHDPKALIRDIYRLLRPGGTFFIETPNIDSVGSRIYKQHWRGVEAPRHLVLFNHKSLRDLLLEVGFEVVKSVSRGYVSRGIFQQSANIEAGLPPLEKTRALPLMDRARLFVNAPFKKRSEFLTFIVRKPDGA